MARCGYAWVSPMRGWVRCQHNADPHDRHVNDRSWVTVPAENSFPHRWITDNDEDIVERFIEKLRNRESEETPYIYAQNGQVCIDGWVNQDTLSNILHELIAEEKEYNDGPVSSSN